MGWLPWFSMIFHDFPWFTRIFHDVPWFTMIMYQDFPWCSMIFHDLPWFSMIFLCFFPCFTMISTFYPCWINQFSPTQKTHLGHHTSSAKRPATVAGAQSSAAAPVLQPPSGRRCRFRALRGFSQCLPIPRCLMILSLLTGLQFQFQITHSQIMELVGNSYVKLLEASTVAHCYQLLVKL